jgi:TonB family protein
MRPFRVVPMALAFGLLGSALFSAQEAPLVAGSEGVPVPKSKKIVKPAYPPEALAQGIRGIVILDLVIDEQGHVEDVSVIRSIPGLDGAAVAAARQWEYEPVKVDGRPVKVRLTVPITFALKLPEVSRQAGIPELRQGVTPRGPEGTKSGGRAVAEVTLDPDGRIGIARIVEGEEPWATALLQALRTWRFATPPDDVSLSFRVAADFAPGRGQGERQVNLRLEGLQESSLLAPAAPGAGGNADAASPASAGAEQGSRPAAPAGQASGTEASPGQVGEAAAGAPAEAPPAGSPASVAPASAPPPAPAGPSAAAPASVPTTASAPTGAPTGTAAPPAEGVASPPTPPTATPEKATPATPAGGEAATPGPPPSERAAPPVVPPAAPAAGPAAPATPTALPGAPAGPAAPSAGGASGPTAPPPVEVVTAPPPPLPPENGISAIHGVTLEPGVPDLTKGRRPVAPPLARMAGATGEVHVDFSVGAGGITTVQEVRGPQILQAAARGAVETWTFRRTRAERLYLTATFTYGADTASADVRPQTLP